MIDELIGMARDMNCSDVHIACGEPPIVRKNGELKRLADMPAFTPRQIKEIALEMLQKSGNSGRPEKDDIDFSYQMSSGERQRVKTQS